MRPKSHHSLKTLRELVGRYDRYAVNLPCRPCVELTTAFQRESLGRSDRRWRWVCYVACMRR